MMTKSMEWLNEQQVEKILQSGKNDKSIKVIKINVQPATGKGNNYTSEVYRISAEYSCADKNTRVTKKDSIIVKVAPSEEGHLKDVAIKAGLFHTETTMMMDTLNRMNELLGYKYPLNGKGLYGQEEEPVFLAIQDLSPLGFRMTDRQQGLDLNHCILAVQGLARFHASSVRLIEKNPEVKNNYTQGIFCRDLAENMPQFVSFFVENTKAVADVIKTWPEVDQKYAEKILNIANNIYEIGIKSSELREGDFNVLTHGDFWNNNMMFRYDDSNKPIGHIMMDFQICKYTSPAIDLLYLFSNSISDEVEKYHKTTIIQEYHKTLRDTMKEIGCKTAPLSLEKLHHSLKDRAAYGMITTFTIFPIILVDKSEVISVDEMMSSDNVKTNPGIHTPRFRRVLKERLVEFEELGLFET